MGGVDRVKQHLNNYPVIKNRGNKYYYKMLLHLLIRKYGILLFYMESKEN